MGGGGGGGDVLIASCSYYVKSTRAVETGCLVRAHGRYSTCSFTVCFKWISESISLFKKVPVPDCSTSSRTESQANVGAGLHSFGSGGEESDFNNCCLALKWILLQKKRRWKKN